MQRRLRVGIVLPTFRTEPDSALALARRAEAAGLAGVFVYDHLFPIGGADRPALHGPTLAAAVLATTSRLCVGTLVTRIGSLPCCDLDDIFRTLAASAPGRVIAGLGLGDRASDPERVAYGLPAEPLDRRIAELRALCQRLRANSIETWIGGRGSQARALALDVADGWNGWMAATDELRAMTRPSFTVSWAGPLPAIPIVEHLRGTDADWIIYAPVDIHRDPAQAQRTLDSIAAAALEAGAT